MACYVFHRVTFLFVLLAEVAVGEELTVGPAVAEVVEGDEVTMKCETTTADQPVNWLYKPSPAASARNICINGKLWNGYPRFFRVDHKPNTRVYNLVLFSAKITDAGMYICVEDSGFGPGRGFLQLNVLERSVDTTVIPAESTASDAANTVAFMVATPTSGVNNELQSVNVNYVIVPTMVIALIVVVACISCFIKHFLIPRKCLDDTDTEACRNPGYNNVGVHGTKIYNPIRHRDELACDSEPEKVKLTHSDKVSTAVNSASVEPCTFTSYCSSTDGLKPALKEERLLSH